MLIFKAEVSDVLRFSFSQMLDDLVSKLKLKHYRTLASKGEMVCPDCRMETRRITDGTAGAMRCEACGVTALLEEWSAAGKDSKLVGHADAPPYDTKIIRGSDGQTTTWQIPASGGGCFLLFFGAFWLAGTAVGSMAALFDSDGSDGGGEIQGFWLIPFFSVFWIVGIGVLYMALRMRYARHLLTVGSERITLRRELFGRVKEMTMLRADIVSIAQKEFYQQNYQPVYGIEIKGRRSRIRFGTGMSLDEKSWLVADLRRVVKAEGVSARSPAPEPGGLAANIGNRRLSSFSFPLPVSMETWLPSAFVMIVIGAALAWAGWQFAPGDAGVFRFLWIGIWSIVACFGLWMLLNSESKCTAFQLQ